MTMQTATYAGFELLVGLSANGEAAASPTMPLASNGSSACRAVQSTQGTVQIKAIVHARVQSPRRS